MQEKTLAESIQELLAKKHLLSANQILSNLAEEGKSYNKTSVYRALDSLLADNLVCRHYFSDSEAKYELRDHHHDHLVCNSCGTVSVSECRTNHTQAIDDFVIDHHHTTIFGRCQNCQNN